MSMKKSIIGLVLALTLGCEFRPLPYSRVNFVNQVQQPIAACEYNFYYNGPRNYMVKFLFFGAISLFTLNVVRIFLLIIIDGYFSNFFDIFYLSSSYIFFHPFILLMWYKWTQIEPN